MKKIIFAIMIIWASTSSNAQQLDINQTTVSYDKNSYPAYQVTLEPDTKSIKKRFKSFMDDKYDIRIKGIGFLTNKDVLSAEQSNIKTISSKTMDLYTKVIEQEGKTVLSIFGRYGYDIYISPEQDREAFQNLRTLIIDFLGVYLPEFYTDQLEEAQELVANVKRDQSSLKEDITDNKGAIQDHLDEVEQLRKENKGLLKKLDDTSSQLAKRERELNTAKKELQRINDRLSTLDEK